MTTAWSTELMKLFMDIRFIIYHQPIQNGLATTLFMGIDQSHNSYNASVPYPTMQHFATKMRTFCYKIVHCDIWYWCVMGFVQPVFSSGGSFGKQFIAQKCLQIRFVFTLMRFRWDEPMWHSIVQVRLHDVVLDQTSRNSMIRYKGYSKGEIDDSNQMMID